MNEHLEVNILLHFYHRHVNMSIIFTDKVTKEGPFFPLFSLSKCDLNENLNVECQVDCHFVRSGVP